ncbi:MAG TPA: MBL fold metallo-hydrolase [Chloroflexi bacterium]|jgi:L-ascorbate metabolism protein UlaG (beta-lactamase superfamily)|nr:MBL fold metallo-hydrolase [Chloroflexota bacterium]
MLEGINWLGHASFCIEGEWTIYIDPWKISDGPPADLVLVTHQHHDHLSPADIAKVRTPDTVVVCPQVCAGQLEGSVRLVKVGQTVVIGPVTVEVVPAYNTNKPNHPKEAGHVGYVVTVGGRRIYHAGDTDLIPEMDDIHCDVALLPIGGTYTMDADEAAQALERIKPQVAVPMHWGDVVGSKEDVERFRRQAPEGVRVEVLKAEA